MIMLSFHAKSLSTTLALSIALVTCMWGLDCFWRCFRAEDHWAGLATHRKIPLSPDAHGVCSAILFL